MNKKNIPYAPILFKKAPEPVPAAENRDINAHLSGPRYHYEPLHTDTIRLKKGSVRYEGRLPLPCDILWERDQPITLRDGTVIYVDVFRPADTKEQVPAILSSSPFGKDIGIGRSLDAGPQGAKLHVTPGCLSGYQKFEGPDPAHWCQYGYAIVNTAPRGTDNSDGNACYFGPQDAADGYDMVEWCAGQDWCNGAVTMSGNSWLAITQYYVAAARPPHLACIAPWEGHGDMYNCEYIRGGIPHPHVTRRDVTSAGKGMEEDLFRMVEEYPLWNSYWEDKCAKFEDIEVPCYLVGSYTNGCHTYGTFEAWMRMGSKEKWFRIHNTQEFPDYYNPEHIADLRKFYDHYCKGIDNGWEKTPRVRMAILDPGHTDQVDRVETDFPLPRQQLKTLYLNAADGTLREICPDQEAVVVNEAEMSGQFLEDLRENTRRTGPFAPPDVELIPMNLENRRAAFTMTFDQDTEITGYASVKLWVEADGADDMDIFIRLMKTDADGNVLFHDAYSQLYSGPSNKLRVSHRALDPERSTPNMPFQSHLQEEKLQSGEIVPVEIGFWPTSVRFHAGERLVLYVQSFDDMGPEGYGFPVECGSNHGRHIIHTGGQFDSKLIIPVIPN